MIQCLATGVDHVLRCPSLKPDTLLTSGRGVHGAPMRETVVYLMMAVSRGVAGLVEEQKAHVWNRRFYCLLLGKPPWWSASALSQRHWRTPQGLRMHVVGVTRTPRRVAGFDEMLPTDRLHDAAGRADFLINVLPANATTRPVRPGGVRRDETHRLLHQRGRGQTVDEGALTTALRETLDRRRRPRRVPDRAAAGRQSVLDLPNVFITPHLGLYQRIRGPDHALIIENMRAFLAGGTARCRTSSRIEARHCEERSDEAIQVLLLHWIASLRSQ